MSQKRYAYLIGANGPENIRLQYAETDVTRLAEVLRGPVCQFTEVKTVIAHSSGEGLTTFQPFVEKCDASDTLLVHFSGHAFFDTIDQQLYLLCNNTDSNNLITAIDISVIKRILRRSRAQSKLLILDCCHAKAAYDVKSEESEEEIRDLVKKATQGSMSAILSACAGKDKTREFRDLDGGSGFLSWAVRAACSTRLEDASTDPEKKALSLSDLDRWVKRALDEANTTLNLHPPLPTPYLFRDQAVGNDIWLTPPPSLNGKPSIPGNEEKRRRYLNEVSKRYSSVTLPIDSSEGLSLHAIFQPLALRSDPLAAEDLERKQRRKFLGESAEEELHDLAEPAQHRKSRETNKPAQPKIAQHGEDALSESPQGRIVILGGPGTGKTTTLRYLVSRRAQEALEKTTTNTQTLLPIFLSLADLARSGKTFQSYLQDVVENLMIERSYADVLWAEIERGRAFVALDSLDEVIPSLRPQMIEQVNHLAARHGNIWVVGSRFTDYKGGQLKHGQFAEWELLSMTPQLRRELATKLLPELLQLPLAKTTMQLSPLEFVNLLEKHSQAATWGDNPLLFSLAAVVFIKTGGLPSSRSSLYREVIEAILTLKEQDSVARRHLQRALTGLSLWLYQEKKGRTFTTDDLFTFLEEIQKRSWDEADTIVRKITTSGILDIVARETYGFRHQTFQEYLAAAELAQQLASSGEKSAKAYEFAWNKRTYSRWTEVLRLMVGVLVQLPERKGPIEATHWLNKLIKQRETEEGDPGDLGLTLALISLAEVGDGERWETGRAREIIQLETYAISLWVKELLDAVRKGRKARAERFQTLAEDIVHLRMLGKEVVIQQLIQALRDVNRKVQEAAAKTLKTLGMWISENDLLLLLRNPGWQVRQAVVEVLGSLGDQVPLDRLFPLLEDPGWQVRQGVVEVLGSLGDQIPIDCLLPLLEDPAPDVRQGVVEVLGSLGDQIPIDCLLPLLEDPAPDVRQGVVQVLGTQKMQLLITSLMPYFYQKDEDVRQSVIRILEMRNEPISRDLFMNLLSDESSGIRQIVLHILQKQSSQMLSDLASQALAVLDGQIGGQIFPTLIQMQVADTIGDLGIASTTLLEKLTELLDWPHWQVRIKAAQALGKIRRNIPDAALERLLKLRRDSDPNMRAVRDAADDALAEILSLETGIEDD